MFSRAGRVRAMTYKVETEDRQKKVTGRAKKRSQYSRRIVQEIDGNSQKTQGNN